ncbi:hypothetical protein SAMN02745116_01632 [Pilibacter termitis]|uniref:Uncharacterized protein n=1 Tax=Pilibacter termitis TaxID=263852 RepID=A0A1T4P3K7_9ENTE|nr:hypothetical protein [Pilibacter termitis]SJZ86039.1 hypothetical protein SAMN02745116_01632 [Pilibacter termitis]
MKNLKKKMIAGMIVVANMCALTVPTAFSVVNAKEIEISSKQSVDKKIEQALQTFGFQEETSQYLKKEGSFSEYKGVNLEQTNFDEKKMNAKEKKFFHQLVVEEAEKSLKRTGKLFVTKKELQNEGDNIKRLLFTMGSGKKSPIQARWFRLMSVNTLAACINILIGGLVFMFTGGAGTSIVTAVKKKGLKVVSKWIKDNLLGKIKNKLLALGISGGLITGIARLIDTIAKALNPGLLIARWIDSIDRKRNNGYIEVG